MKYILLIVVFCLAISAASVNANVQLGVNKPTPTNFTFVYPDVVKQLQNMKIPTDIDEQGLEDLYHRYYQHYKDFLGSNPKKEVTYDWLMDEENARISFELDYLFSLARAKKLDVSRFSIFGLHVQLNGNTLYDYQKCKYLLSIFDLHEKILTPELFDTQRFKLLNMGLTSDELELVKLVSRQVVKNDKLRNTMILLYYQYQAAIADSMKYAVKYKNALSPERFQYLLNREMFASKYIQHTLRRHAALQLLNQFTPQQQSILKRFLIDHSTITTRGQPDYEDGLIARISAIKSGEWYEKLQSNLKVSKKLEVW